jgi:hypothetical protein
VSGDESAILDVNNLEVYPNPFGNSITINIGRLPPPGTILTVYDMQATEVYRTEVSAVNEVILTAHWPEGMYIVQWRDDEGRVYIQKAVKGVDD